MMPEYVWNMRAPITLGRAYIISVCTSLVSAIVTYLLYIKSL